MTKLAAAGTELFGGIELKVDVESGSEGPETGIAEGAEEISREVEGAVVVGMEDGEVVIGIEVERLYSVSLGV